MLRNRQAMVMGPTPPGTGVMWPATSAASSKATSPTSFVLGCPASFEAFFRRRHAINADIYDARTRLDPIAPDHFGNADSGDENIGIPAQVRQVVRARMGDADRAIFAKQ